MQLKLQKQEDCEVLMKATIISTIYLEMLAVFLGLKAYKQFASGKHIKVLVDNTTTQATKNKMGTSHSPILNNLTK